MPAKKKKAPDWFISNRAIREELDSRVAELLSIGLDWVKKQTDSRKVFELAAQRNLPKNTKDELHVIYNYIIAMADYSWARFRFENKDNEFGVADSLHYNPKTNSIHIKVGVKSILSKMLGELERKLGIQGEII